MDDKFPEGMIASISNFLVSDSRRPIGQDVYEEIFDHPLMFPLQRQRELKKMMQLARTINPQVVCEIGADKSGGIYHWCKSLPTVRRVLVSEIRGLPYAIAYEKAFPQIDFKWLEGSSHYVWNLKLARRWLDTNAALSSIDILFIDGDKSRFDYDFACYLPLMSTKGIVFFHDITDPAPREAYDRICRMGFRHAEYIDRTDSEEAQSRMDQGIDSKTPHESWLRHWKGASCGVGIVYVDG